MPHVSAVNGAIRVALDEGVIATLPHDQSSIAVAAERAEGLLARSLAATTRKERRQQARLAAVVHDEQLRALTFALTDEVLRFGADRRAAARLRSIVADVGVPSSLGRVDRVLLRVGSLVAPILPWVVMPMVRSRIIRESNGVVLAADDPAFARHAAQRSADGFRLNVNVLGEAILSDAEAAQRMSLIRARIARPDVTYVSLKISAVVANLDVLAFDQSVDRICACLRALYRDAIVDGTFINLDMEEYRDLPLTIAALTRVLAEPEFAALDAGVVLQAYLPDSHAACAQLCEWALARHARTGAVLKIRIVKGANLAMERVEAEQHGWVQAPYATKAEVDASFKRLVTSALDGRFGGAVRVGFASHNLFDLAWALGLPARDRLDIEMLEGMAPAQSRAVLEEAGAVLLYAPVVRHDDLAASIAYLTRRLDENTSPDNFLRDLFTLRPGSPEWQGQRSRFEAAMVAADSVSVVSRRTQDRSLPAGPVSIESFANCADTDWTQEANRSWITRELAGVVATDLVEVPLIDTVGGVDEVVAAAVGGVSTWAATSFADRRQVLAAAADEMERSRGHTLALMARTACKTIAEGDPEVSEAIDFARYYAWCTHALEARIADGLEFVADGVVLVASPWNFPYAIPAGGVCAALAAGNAVILKPAPEVRTVAFELAEQLWRAGVPRDVLQFVACPDNEVGRRLVTHDSVATVVLTGAYETAQLFRSWKPSIRVLAETSGKNAMVITAAADEDAAIRDLVKSAFGHAGQKCSAASLAIVEASVYDDPAFLRRLADAVRSVRVGVADDLSTLTGPLVGEPSPKLLRALTALEPGERWLVEPECLDTARHLWSPGVRMGVKPGSWFHLTECFGPVLGLMRADDLSHAIELQNTGDFGLTGGIQSLDEHEIRRWLELVEVGNAYVNRHITGAVVQRQPFGGWKRSSVGCGPKAGVPFYVEAFGTWSSSAQATETVDRATLEAQKPTSATVEAQLRPQPLRDGLRGEFEVAWRECFGAEHDPSGLACERNVLRYRPLPGVRLHVAANADPALVAIAVLARGVTGVPEGGDRVRVIGTASDAELIEWHARGWDVDRGQPVADPMVELRHWVREQSISATRHRHGRLLD